MSNASVLQLFRKYCCCLKSSTTPDHERLLNGGGASNSDEAYAVPNGTTAATYASSSRTALSDRNLPAQGRTREEEEEELMNKILDRTQQSIIDVTNLENNSLDFDMIQRSRLYAEAVKRHDAMSDRRRGLMGGSGDQSNPSDVENHGGLLANLGPRVPELLTTRPADCSRNDLDQLDRASELFLDAHRLGAQIECKEELIVYMSLDD